MKGNTIQRRLTVEVISFSAHVDGEQNLDFIDQVKAQHIVCILYSSLARTNGYKVLMHGEAKAMYSLKNRLEQIYSGSEEGVKVHMPWNTETLNLTFRGDRIAKVGLLVHHPDVKPHTSYYRL